MRRTQPFHFELLEDRTLLSFTEPAVYPTGLNPAAATIVDLNGDGHPDVAIANQNSNTVSVLLGNGDGTLRTNIDYTTGSTPTALTAGDFNGDGKSDLVTANFGTNTISILLGLGDGSFHANVDIAVGATPVSLAAADFNGDGKLDLAVAAEDNFTDYVKTFLGNGDGTFKAPLSIATDFISRNHVLQMEMTNVAVADFNNDGHPDVVVVNNLDTAPGNRIPGQVLPGSVSVILGNGDGSFQTPKKFALGNSPRSVTVGDFNGDGRMDFAVANTRAGTLTVFLGSGDGNFPSHADYIPGTTPVSVVAGDFNGDGRVDLAVGNAPNGGLTHDVAILPGQGAQPQGDGTFSAPTAYLADTVLGSIAAGDLNGDGHPDVVSVNSLLNKADVWLNNGAGILPGPVLVPDPGLPMSTQATADFNGDGIPDLATVNSSVQVQLGLGDGHYGDTVDLPAGLAPSSLAVTDYNADTRPDLIVNSLTFGGKVGLMLNTPGWDNRTGGAVGLTISAPQYAPAGAGFSVIVTAVDAAGDPVSGFRGSVSLDDLAVGSTSLNFAGQQDFTAADAGKHSFVVPGLAQAGAYILSAFAAGLGRASIPLTIVPALPSISLATAADDRMRLRLDPNDHGLLQLFTHDPPTVLPDFAAPLASLPTLTIDGLAGNDTLIVDLTNGDPVPAAGLTFDGGDGADALLFAGLTGNQALTASPLIVAGAIINYVNVEKLGFAEGSVNLASMPAGLGLVAAGSASVNLINSVTVASLDITGDAQVSLAPGGLKALRVGTSAVPASASSLNIAVPASGAGFAGLDVNDNGLILQAGNAADRDALLAQVTALVRQARGANGTWTGNGIRSGTAKAEIAANSTAFATGIALTPNVRLDQTGAVTGPLKTTFKGQGGLDTNTVLAAYSLNGDTNLDGLITFDDYFQVNSGFLSGGTKAGYQNGDLNLDGIVNFDDYFLINTAFLGQGAKQIPPMATVAGPFRTTRISPRAFRRHPDRRTDHRRP